MSELGEALERERRSGDVDVEALIRLGLMEEGDPAEVHRWLLAGPDPRRLEAAAAWFTGRWTHDGRPPRVDLAEAGPLLDAAARTPLDDRSALAWAYALGRLLLAAPDAAVTARAEAAVQALSRHRCNEATAARELQQLLANLSERRREAPRATRMDGAELSARVTAALDRARLGAGFAALAALPALQVLGDLREALERLLLDRRDAAFELGARCSAVHDARARALVLRAPGATATLPLDGLDVAWDTAFAALKAQAEGLGGALERDWAAVVIERLDVAPQIRALVDRFGAGLRVPHEPVPERLPARTLYTAATGQAFPLPLKRAVETPTAVTDSGVADDARQPPSLRIALQLAAIQRAPRRRAAMLLHGVEATLIVGDSEGVASVTEPLWRGPGEGPFRTAAPRAFAFLRDHAAELAPGFAARAGSIDDGGG